MGDSIYTIDKQGNAVILTLILDNITMYQNEELQKAFTDLLDKGSKNIVLDLSKTDYMSSIVLASLVFMIKRAKEAGGNLVICGVREKVRKVLALTNLDKVFDIFENSEKAVARLAKKS
jgi:anti-anti-sigma factor